VPFYAVLDHLSMEPQESGKTQADLLILRSEDGDHLPMFTSMALFCEFVDDYFDGDDSIEPSPFPMDPFYLAEVMASLAENDELGFLIFNPTAHSAGVWSIERDPIPVAHYCRFASEIRPGIQQAVREYVARFGTATPGSAADKEAMEWLRPRIERLTESAGTGVDEWWERHGV
jgi:hypothetical protein